MVPNQMRYQTALHSEALRAIEFKAFERKGRKHENGTNGLPWRTVDQKSHAKRHEERDGAVEKSATSE